MQMTQHFLVGKSLRFLHIKIQHDLNQLCNWLNINRHKLNVNKTKMLLFNREGLFPDFNLQIEQQRIEVLRTFKFLGVTLDMSLSFELHFRQLHDKLIRSTYVVRSLAHFLPSICLRTLYFVHYHAHILYCLHMVPFIKLISARVYLQITEKNC